MKILPRFLSLLLLGLVFVQATFATKIFDEFKNNLGPIIKDVCHSSIDYSITDSVGFDFINTKTKEELVCSGGKCQEYHQKINCLFNDGLKNIIQNVNTEITKDIFSNGAEGRDKKNIFKTKLLPASDIQNCPKETLLGAYGAQKNRGFISRCRDFESKSAALNVSACRVAEAVLLEYCGYEKFLLAKSKDKESFVKEFQAFDELTDEIPFIAKTTYQKELNAAKQSLFETLSFYQNIEYSYRINTWLESFWFQLGLLHEKITTFTKALSVFPAKFLNTSINS